MTDKQKYWCHYRNYINYGHGVRIFGFMYCKCNQEQDLKWKCNSNSILVRNSIRFTPKCNFVAMEAMRLFITIMAHTGTEIIVVFYWMCRTIRRTLKMKTSLLLHRKWPIECPLQRVILTLPFSLPLLLMWAHVIRI